MAAFTLSKWYLDCVTSSGDASIVYSGTASWGPVRLHYASLLESRGTQLEVRQQRRHTEPQIQKGCLRWRSESLNVDGEWYGNSHQLRETIFQSEAGAIEWHCLMPRARARIGASLGHGYVEHLSMTIAPWRMPIASLRWGRFLTEDHSLIWIDWLGPTNRRLMYWNNRTVEPLAIDDDRLVIAGGSRLTMDRSLILREGPIGTTALANIPGIRHTFPVRLLRIGETKWRSRARLELADGSIIEGWAIHERVDWPPES